MSDAAETDGSESTGGLTVSTEPLPAVTTDPAAIERGLKPEFRAGLEALRQYEGIPAEVVEPITRGNDNDSQVFVCLGVWNLPAINAEFDDECEDTALYARFSRNFGRSNDEGRQYGFATYPVTTFENGNRPPAVRVNRSEARELADALNVPNNEVAMWSHHWNQIDVTCGEDMTRAVSTIRRRLRRPR